MMLGQRSRLLGSLVVLAAVCTLALAACNSSSSSSNQSKPSSATSAEVKIPSSGKSSPAKALDAAITQTR